MWTFTRQVGSNKAKCIQCRIQGPESLHIFYVWMQSDWILTSEIDFVWQKAGWTGNRAGKVVHIICRVSQMRAEHGQMKCRGAGVLQDQECIPLVQGIWDLVN